LRTAVAAVGFGQLVDAEKVHTRDAGSLMPLLMTVLVGTCLTLYPLASNVTVQSLLIKSATDFNDICKSLFSNMCVVDVTGSWQSTT
jgi:hypothetical protein